MGSLFVCAAHPCRGRGEWERAAELREGHPGAGGTTCSRAAGEAAGCVCRCREELLCVAFDACLVPKEDFPLKIPPWAGGGEER